MLIVRKANFILRIWQFEKPFKKISSGIIKLLSKSFGCLYVYVGFFLRENSLCQLSLFSLFSTFFKITTKNCKYLCFKIRIKKKRVFNDNITTDFMCLLLVSSTADIQLENPTYCLQPFFTIFSYFW